MEEGREKECRGWERGERVGRERKSRERESREGGE